MTFLELFGLVRKHIAIVIALPVAFAVIAAGCSFLAMADQYTASTSMYVLTKAQSDNEAITNSDLSASQMITNDVATLVKSSRVQDSAAESVGLSSLSGYSIDVVSTTSTRVITINVTGTDQENVAVVANQLAKTVDNIAQQVMDVKSINVIDQARTPTSPSGPPRLLYIALAFLAGLLIALAFIVIADMANTKVRSGEEAAELTGLTVIGRIPVIR